MCLSPGVLFSVSLAHACTCQAGSGLTGILPKPKQAVAVGAKATKPPPPMVPYTLTKRPTPTAKRKPCKPTSKVTKVTEDSDSDGEPASFFSLEEKTKDPVAAPMPNSIPGSHSAESSPGPTPVPGSSAAVCSGYEYGGSAPEAVNTAPSAPRPFSVEQESGWSYHIPEEAGWDGQEVGGGWEGQATHTTSDRAAETQQMGAGAGPLLGAGPGLSMDEKTVSAWWGVGWRMLACVCAVPQADWRKEKKGA